MIVNASTVRRLLRQHGIDPRAAARRIDTRPDETQVYCTGPDWAPIVGAALTAGWSDAVARLWGTPGGWTIRRHGTAAIGPMPPIPAEWGASDHPMPLLGPHVEQMGLRGWAWLVYAELHNGGSLDGTAPHRLDPDVAMALMRSPWTVLVDPPANVSPRMRRLIVSPAGSALIRTAVRKAR